MKRVFWCKTAAIALAVAAAAVMLPRVGSPQTPAPASADATRRGEAWFYQRCSLCHMGRIVKDDVYEPMGPKLTGLLKNATPAREKAVRDQIQRGSPRMPGFQYTFTPAEFEELIAYMKTL
jgi:mono/diheme cytochrome c family protein